MHAISLTLSALVAVACAAKLPAVHVTPYDSEEACSGKAYKRVTVPSGPNGFENLKCVNSPVPASVDSTAQKVVPVGKPSISGCVLFAWTEADCNGSNYQFDFDSDQGGCEVGNTAAGIGPVRSYQFGCPS